MGQILHIDKVFVKCTYYNPVGKSGLRWSKLVIISCKLVDKPVDQQQTNNSLVKLVVFWNTEAGQPHCRKW